MQEHPAPLCTRCSRPVQTTRASYEAQESMHWLCFHLEFEHDGDPDSPCDDPSCPWRRIGRLQEELRRRGFDPLQVEDEGLLREYGLAPPSPP